MRHLTLVAFAAAALTCASLSGCTTVERAVGRTPSASAEVQADKQQIAVETAFALTSTAVETAHTAGVLRGDTAAKVRSAYAKAHTALLAERAAYAAGATGDRGAQAKALAEAASSIATLVNASGRLPPDLAGEISALIVAAQALQAILGR